MVNTFPEGDLRVTFTSGRSEKFDASGIKTPEGLKRVDFIVEETDRILLIEFKDPSDPGMTAEDREKARKEIQNPNFVNGILVRKARDTYTYLHLMKRDNKPFVFVVLICAAKLSLDGALLAALQQGLESRLAQEADQPWERKYIDRAILITEEHWAKHFSFPLVRISTGRAP